MRLSFIAWFGRVYSAGMVILGPSDSARWLIAEMVDEARLSGQPLSDREERTLSTEVAELSDRDRDFCMALHNRLVPLIRQRIDRAKAEGGPTVKVRRGLTMPIDWNEHYGQIYRHELPWFVSGVMQSAVLSNPLVGEKKPWKSK